MFRPHKSICISCNQEKIIVVKKGLCGVCNHNSKPKSKTKKYSYTYKKTGEAELFAEIWHESNRQCFVCDKHISYPIAANFAHILPKALNKFPKFKLHKPNIKLMCYDLKSPSCYYLWDHTPRSDLKSTQWQKVFELEAQLKEEYKLIS